MLRNLSRMAAKNVPGIVEKKGVILATAASPGTFEVAIDGNRYTQVRSANLINYIPGTRVTVLFDQGVPTIVP